jgi:hypothetical protein
MATQMHGGAIAIAYDLGFKMLAQPPGGGCLACAPAWSCAAAAGLDEVLRYSLTLCVGSASAAEGVPCRPGLFAASVCSPAVLLSGIQTKSAKTRRSASHYLYSSERGRAHC